MSVKPGDRPLEVVVSEFIGIINEKNRLHTKLQFLVEEEKDVVWELKKTMDNIINKRASD